MGMEVYVYTRTPRPTPESRVDTATYCIPGTGDPEGVIPAAWFSGDLDEFLAQDLDILVVSAGLTEQTRSMVGKRQLEILGGDGVADRKKGFLCNIARGPIVDTDALTEALEKGTIAGAALDVTDPEPLPKGHPLWKAPNLFITPHVSWQSLNVMPRVADLLQKNLERLDNGEPLLNPIKK
jgi:phosphoglycerate dehydrogenase-like enzyme